MNQVGAQAGATATPARRTSLTGALLVAALTELLVLAGAAAVALLTDASGRLGWLVAPVVGVAVAMGKILLGEAATPRAGRPPQAERPARGAGADARVPRPARRRGTRTGVAVLVVLLVVGGGGWVLAQAVGQAVGYVTGDERGEDRLVAPVAATTDGLTLGVDAVVQTAHFTRVAVVVTNGLPNTVTLPLFGNASLAAEDGTTLEADPSRSRFAETLAPGAVRRGTLVFVGHLPAGPATASLTFATVFEHGFDGPASLTLPGVAVTAAAGS